MGCSTLDGHHRQGPAIPSTPSSRFVLHRCMVFPYQWLGLRNLRRPQALRRIMLPAVEGAALAAMRLHLATARRMHFLGGGWTSRGAQISGGGDHGQVPAVTSEATSGWTRSDEDFVTTAEALGCRAWKPVSGLFRGVKLQNCFSCQLDCWDQYPRMCVRHGNCNMFGQLFYDRDNQPLYLIHIWLQSMLSLPGGEVS